MNLTFTDAAAATLTQEIIQCDPFRYPNDLKYAMVIYGVFWYVYMLLKRKLPPDVQNAADGIFFVVYCGLTGSLWMRL